jgi:hypothetical protein
MVIPLVEPQIYGLLVESLSLWPSKLHIELTQITGDDDNAVCCCAHMPGTRVNFELEIAVSCLRRMFKPVTALIEQSSNFYLVLPPTQQ